MRKSYLIITVLLLSTFIAGTSAGYYGGQRFYDVPQNYWATNSINFVSAQGLMNGRPNGSFDPAGTVNRAELAVILHRLYSNKSPIQQYNVQQYSNNFTNSNNFQNSNEDQRDFARRQDVRAIADALRSYARDNDDKFPKTIKDTFTEICYSSSGESCKSKIELSVLLGEYVNALPRDPTLRTTKDASTGYFVKLDDDGRAQIIAKLSNNTIIEIREP